MSISARGRPEARRATWPDLAGIGSIVLAAFAYLSPALKDGARFGSFDFVLPLTSLGRSQHQAAPFNHLNSDVVSQMNAWNGFDWNQVHAGHFPLWNDLSVLGLPHFFNFESAVLSAPDLVGYLVPLRFAFIVTVLVKLLIAGFGAYFLARVLSVQPLGASFAGISYMLSGAFSSWLSWPLADVTAWLGWILAFAVLVYRYPSRMRYPAGLVVSLAFCLYGGFPEGNVFVGMAVGLLIVVFVGARLVLRRRRREEQLSAFRSGEDPRRRPTGLPSHRLSRHGVAALAGSGAVAGMLALPLWWPGWQLVSLSHRRGESHFPGLPLHSLTLLVAQGYYGLPTRENSFFLSGWNYYETASYVGIVMLVLAVVAVMRHRRQPTVIALVGLCVAIGLICWQISTGVHPVQSFMSAIVGQVEWGRFRTVLGLPLGLLAGIGLEEVVGVLRYSTRPAARRSAVSSFAVATAVAGAGVLVLYLLDAGTSAAESVRARSLIWPLVSCVVCVGVLALIVPVSRRFSDHRRDNPGSSTSDPAAARIAVGGVLWSVNAAALLFAGVGINSYSHSYYKATPAITALRQKVGSSLVGLDTGRRSPVAVQQFLGDEPGFYPEVNLGYQVAEFAAHDPTLPQMYFEAFGVKRGGPGFFEPDIDSVALARRYGTPYVLASPLAPPLVGGRRVGTYAGQVLYSIPGASRFTLSGGGALSAIGHPSAAEYDLQAEVKAASAGSSGRRHQATLVARITDVPGWHASVDGKEVPIRRANGVMIAVSLPAGHHQVRFWYWPSRLSEGLVAATLGFLGFLGWAGTVWRARLRRRGHPEPEEARSSAPSDIFSIRRQ
jgi:hypothetical protein